MLVVGVQGDGVPFYSDVDIDPDVDSPRNIHNLLMKKANGKTFVHILCIENDEVVAEFSDEVDYDLSDKDDEDEVEAVSDEDLDSDHLHEEDSDDNDDD